MNNEQVRALALIAAANARIAGMQAANSARDTPSEAPAYGEDAFAIEAQQLEDLATWIINT